MIQHRISIASLLFGWGFALIGLSNLAIGQDAAPKDESQEPGLTFVVEVDNQAATIVEGKSTQLKGTFSDPTVAIKVKPTRLFPYGGVEFEYPRSFTFEADVKDADYKDWTLSGNDCKILLQWFDEPLAVKDYAEYLIVEFGRENCTLEAAAPLKVGERELSGTMLKARFASAVLTMEIYAMPAPQNQTRLLVIQDNREDDGSHSTEHKRTLQLLTRTIRFP